MGLGPPGATFDAPDIAVETDEGVLGTELPDVRGHRRGVAIGSAGGGKVGDAVVLQVEP